MVEACRHNCRQQPQRQRQPSRKVSKGREHHHGIVLKHTLRQPPISACWRDCCLMAYYSRLLVQYSRL